MSREREWFLPVSGTGRNIIFIFLIFLAVISLVVADARGRSQNAVWESDYRQYQEARELIRTQQYPEAEKLIKELLPAQEDSFAVAYLYGICLARQGRYQEAEGWLLKAREIRPGLVLNQGYLLNLGEMYLETGRLDLAGKYARQSLEAGKNEGMESRARVVLKRINDKQGKGQDNE